MTLVPIDCGPWGVAHPMGEPGRQLLRVEYADAFEARYRFGDWPPLFIAVQVARTKLRGRFGGWLLDHMRNSVDRPDVLCGAFYDRWMSMVTRAPMTSPERRTRPLRAWAVCEAGLP